MLATARDSQPGEEPLSIRLFGPLEVRLKGGPLASPLSRKGCWLLALLVLRHGRPVERGWLAGTLWPESPEALALYNLRRELTHLRRALGAAAFRLDSPTPRTLALELSGAAVDLQVFDRAMAAGDPAALSPAVAIYRGPLLEGCEEEWVLPERVARAEQYLQATEALAAQALASEDAAAAICYLRQAAAAEPLRESLHRNLIAALAANGDFPSALEAYRDLRLLLHRELNTEPSAETRALFKRIRRQARERASARPSAAAGADRAAESPLLRILPRPLTNLIGREEQASDVVELVRGNRLVTLTGAGGVGKSRLALRVADQLQPEFADSIWFVELAALTDPALLTETVAAALELREDPARPLAETLIRFLRSRASLLVLDNCEHLLDACARFAERTLQACPQTRILVTSRQSLGMFGEATWRVPSLATPDLSALPDASPDLPERVLAFPAAQLFVERAAQAEPGFRLTPQNARTVAQVSFRLDGIPLALELAAARVPSLPLEQIAARLDDRFRLLTSGSRTAPLRHQTLRATLDWSYQLLTADEQRLLRRLSVFAGGWTLEGAEAVCGGDVLDLLGRLVDRSLVLHEAREGESRYRMLETIRQYALERLSEDAERAELRDRHLEYTRQLCERAEPWLFGAVADAAWIRRIARESDNIRAALDWSEDAPEASARTEAALRSAAAIRWQWFHRGSLKEGRNRLASLLSRRHLASPSTRARALTAFGLVTFWQGDYAAMRAPLEESLPLHRETGDDAETACTLCFLAPAAHFAGEPEVARSLAEEGLALARRQADPRLIPFCLWWYGFTAQARGDYLTAREAFEECLATALAAGSLPGAAHAHAMLGGVEFAAGDLPAALAEYSESLARFHSLDDRWGMTIALQGLMRIAAAQGDAHRAARLGGVTEALREATGASIPPNELESYERMLAQLRGQLGESDFEILWNEGRAWTAPQYLDYVLSSGRMPS